MAAEKSIGATVLKRVGGGEGAKSTAGGIRHIYNFGMRQHKLRLKRDDVVVFNGLCARHAKARNESACMGHCLARFGTVSRKDEDNERSAAYLVYCREGGFCSCVGK